MNPIRKAVIPAAGFGTRFLPFTKAVPKELVPVVDKPVIQYVLDDASRLGLIARPEQWSDERLQFIQILTGKLHLCVHKDIGSSARPAASHTEDVYGRTDAEKQLRCGSTMAAPEASAMPALSGKRSYRR